MSAPYVLLHPLGADRHFWDPVCAELAGPTLALDLPGHGSARLPPLGADADAFTAPVVDRIAALGEPVHLVGLSLGGLVAQQVALQRPDLVASLVLAGSVAVYPESMRDMWRDRARTARAGGLQTLVPAMVEMWFTAELAASGDPRVAQARQTFMTTAPEGYARACEVLATVDLSDRIRELSVPTTVVCGIDEAPVFRDAAAWFGEVIGAPVHMLPGRHACPVEAPELFASVLSAMSDRTSGSALDRR